MPNLRGVSRTRVSIHNMPLTLTESMLKKMVLTEATPDGQLLQVKVVRSKDRVGGDGKLRSKGFGFLEFEKHADALTAIRLMNNNPTLFEPKKRPVVQFAWIDVRVITKILRRREQSKSRVTRSQEMSADGTERPLRPWERKKGPKPPPGETVAMGGLGKGGKGGKPAASRNGTAAANGGAQNRAQQQQQQRPPKPQQRESRKREYGKLGEAPDTSRKEKRSRNKKAEKKQAATDAFDSLVSKYKAKLVGSVTKASSKWAA